MQTTLYPYQQAIRDDVIAKGDFSVALFMKMGTGKTVTSLSIFEHLLQTHKCNKLLVVCIANKVDDWNEDIEKELGHDFQYSVLSFESVWRPKQSWVRDFIQEDTLIILDESHKIKSATSKVSKFMLDVYNQTKYKLILTGTPQSQWYVDYYPQMRFINAKDYDLPYKKWASIFVQKELNREHGMYHYDIVGYNYEEVLKEGIAKKAYYHDYSSDYSSPIHIYQDIRHSKECIKFEKERVMRDPDIERCEDVIADTPLSFRLYRRQALSGFVGPYDMKENPKLEWLKEFLEIQQSRVVIFVCFVKEIEQIEELCKKMNRPCGVYYGARKDLKPFQDNENGVIVVNYASGATGINSLCISNIGVFYSPPDGDFILFSQAKSRLDRIGQTKQPVFYYLQTKGSIERGMYECFKRGQNFDNEQYKVWLELNEKT